jgi:hypothetical protein
VEIATRCSGCCGRSGVASAKVEVLSLFHESRARPALPVEIRQRVVTEKADSGALVGGACVEDGGKLGDLLFAAL